MLEIGYTSGLANAELTSLINYRLSLALCIIVTSDFSLNLLYLPNTVLIYSFGAMVFSILSISNLSEISTISDPVE